MSTHYNFHVLEGQLESAIRLQAPGEAIFKPGSNCRLPNCVVLCRKTPAGGEAKPTQLLTHKDTPGRGGRAPESQTEPLSWDSSSTRYSGLGGGPAGLVPSRSPQQGSQGACPIDSQWRISAESQRLIHKYFKMSSSYRIKFRGHFQNHKEEF